MQVFVFDHGHMVRGHFLSLFFDFMLDIIERMCYFIILFPESSNYILHAARCCSRNRPIGQ